MLARVGHRRRAADKDGVCPVEAADADQPADDVGKMRAENAAVNVQFIDHDVFEVHEKLLPLGVVRQNAGMQHVRIGDDDVALPADGPTRVVGRVSVVGKGFDIGLQICNQAVGFVHLVLCQRLGGKHIQSPRFRLVENTLQHRQIVAKRLTAGSRRHQHDILSVADKTHRLSLMPVEAFHAPPGQYIAKLLVYPGGIVFKVSGFGGNVHHCRRIGVKSFVFFKTRDPFFECQIGHDFISPPVSAVHYR